MADDLKASTSTAVAARPPVVMGERGFDFDFESLQRFAKGLIEGGMVPKGITSPGAVVGLIEAGKELGLPPMYALANLTFTNGRLGIMGDAAKALIRRSGALEPGTDFSATYSGAEFTPAWTCTVSAHRKGQPQPFVRSFSIEDAIVAKLIRLDGKHIKSRKGSEWTDYGPWSTYPDRMLMYRALGFLARDYFSDILAGATLTEELRDFAPELQAQQREASRPSDPDPLLTAAPSTTAPANVIEADVVPDTDPVEATCDSGTALATGAPPEDEAAIIRAVDRLEGQIVTAEKRADLDAVWARADRLLQQVSAKERQRLFKLYEQNAAGFSGVSNA